MIRSDRPKTGAGPPVKSSGPQAAARPGAGKAAATRQRRQQELRADKLDDIRSQIADGTLVVRQMTGAQHRTALQAADRAVAAREARKLRS